MKTQTKGLIVSFLMMVAMLLGIGGATAGLRVIGFIASMILCCFSVYYSLRWEHERKYHSDHYIDRA